MISFKDQPIVISEVITGLLHPSVPTSWNVVLPPVFDDAEFEDEIVKDLRRHTPAPLVAVLSSDTIKTPFEYVEQLYRQWSATVRLPTPTRGTSPDAALHRLLMSVPSDRPAVQILRRFHKILDSLDQWVLGSIRNAEHANKLQTLTIAPFDYEELKRRWERRGKLLMASDYGDTHSIKRVELLPARDIEAICRDRSIPRHVVELALRMTGGYPLPFKGVVEEWIRLSQPSFSPNVIARLRSTAAQRMASIVRHIDAPGETRYRDAIVDLYQLRAEEADEAMQTLSRHPWATLLLAEDGLRAETLGRAAVDATIKDAVGRRADVPIIADIMAKAVGMYRRKQYDTTIKLIDTSCEERYRPPCLRILRAHADVMTALYGSDDDDAGVDTDWRGLRLKVGEARRTLNGIRDKVKMCAEIDNRYDELDAIATSILNATKDGNRRVVDVLAGCAEGSAPVQARTALLLLLLRLESSRMISGDASACHSILALPEQTFRVWAAWSLNLSYYKVPEGSEEIWSEVVRAWPHGTFNRPSPGSQFGSFELFAYFAVAMAHAPSENGCAVPETNLKALTQALSTLDVRRDSAHALTIPSRKVRAQLFDLVDRWFNALLSPCAAHSEAISRDELLAQVEPLPVVGEDYSTIWR